MRGRFDIQDLESWAQEAKMVVCSLLSARCIHGFRFKCCNEHDEVLPLRLQGLETNKNQHARVGSAVKWARRDLNSRSSPCEGDIITPRPRALR